MKSLLSLLPAFVLGTIFALAQACVIANPDHCFNLAIDTNAWCEAVHPDQPYCSPCKAENNGCVAEEPDPDDCPSYTAPMTETGTGTGTDTDTETGTDTGTETGTAG
jgi:hypothetical protein